MKKITILLITAVFFVTGVLAQRSNVILFTENGERFTVILNGIRQNPLPETNVKITDLNAPNYKLKVIFDDQSLGTLDKNLYLEPGTERTFAVKKNKKGIYVLRMISEVQIAYAPPPPPDQKVIVFTTIPPPAAVATSVTVTESVTTTSTGTAVSPQGGNVSVGLNVNDQGMGVNMNININDGMPVAGTTTTTSSITTSSTITTTSGGVAIRQPVGAEPVYVLPGYTGPIGCPMPMSGSEFAGVKSSIASKSFDDSKLTIAKQVIGSNCLLSAQVKEIMLSFSFEDTRLEIAKYAYGYTYDLGNYYKVNDAFDFESTIDELNEYIDSVNR